MSAAGSAASDGFADAMTRAVSELLRGSHLMAPDELPDLVARATQHVGAVEAFLYLADYEQRMLTPLPVTGVLPREALSVDSSLAGRVFQRVEAHEVEIGPAARRLWLPLLDGVERLGVVELVLASEEPLTAER